jgi:prevent-host-death family protein
MPDVSATDAARHFSDLLDAIEHRGEHCTVVWRGRPIARLQPVPRGTGAEVKAVQRRRQPDAAWTDDLADMRDLVTIDQRP